MRYAWLMPGLGRGADAQEIGEHIEDLQQKYREHLTPEEILASARATQSPLHGFFTWDENDAAEKQRRREARSMINNLVVKKNRKPTATRAFIFLRNPDAKRNVYYSLRTAMSRPDLREQAIEQGMNELSRKLHSWQTRFGHLREFRPITKSVDKLRDKLEAELLSAAGTV